MLCATNLFVLEIASGSKNSNRVPVMERSRGTTILHAWSSTAVHFRNSFVACFLNQSREPLGLPEAGPNVPKSSRSALDQKTGFDYPGRPSLQVSPFPRPPGFQDHPPGAGKCEGDQRFGATPNLYPPQKTKYRPQIFNLGPNAFVFSEREAVVEECTHVGEC